MADRLLIVDFGSQVTQLIARRVREAGVYCEIVPFQTVDRPRSKQFDPKAIDPLGRPGLGDRGRRAARADPAIFDAGVPVLGICYGEQTMAPQLGGEVEARPPSRVRPRRASRSRQRSAAVRRRLGRRATRQPGLDEPRRPGHQAAAGLQRRRHLGERALRRDRRRGAQASTACSSIPRWCTRPTAPSCCAISCTRSPASSGDWTMAAFTRPRRSRRSAPRSATGG